MIGARGAAVEHEAGDELRAEDARLGDQLQHLARCPAVERRRLRGDQHEIGGEQRRAHQAGDARRAVDDDVVGVAGELRRFAMQRVARQADDAEQPRAGLPCARCSDQSSAEPCGSASISVTRFPFPGPFAGEMQGERRLADAALLVEERHDHGASRLRGGSCGAGWLPSRLAARCAVRTRRQRPANRGFPPSARAVKLDSRLESKLGARIRLSAMD